MEKLFKKIIYSNNLLLMPIFYILVLLSYVYKFFIVKKRKKGYKAKFTENFIISIGNITFGGTGKTPLTIFLAKELAKRYKVSIIMRGYKGEYKNPHLVNVDNDSVDKVGDEAILISASTGLPVIISRNRAAGIRFANRSIKPDIIILDDAFQHFAVKRDINIVLIDYNNPFGNGRLLPAGILREPVAALKDADYVLITKYEKETKGAVGISDLIAQVKRVNSKAKIFKTGYMLDSIYLNGKRENIKKYVNRKIISVSGIGNPQYFEFMVKKYFKPTQFTSLRFSDHIHYKKNKIQKILKLMNGYEFVTGINRLSFPRRRESHKSINMSQNRDSCIRRNDRKVIYQSKREIPEFVVTTEKDYVKLKKFNIQPLLVMKIKFNIINKNFLQSIINDIKNN